MSYKFLDIASTPSVRAAQAANGSREMWEKFKGHRTFDRFTDDEAAFIAERDSFYMATVSETGWPYVQHRGGPPGFLKVLDEKTLGFADFRGNLQYISVGNVAADDRAALILVDYPNQARLKIFAHVEMRKHRGRFRTCRAARRARLQGQARARLFAAPRNVRLELPAAHHAALHDGCDPGGGRAVAGAHYGA